MSGPLFPPPGWDGVPGGRLPVLLSVPTEDGERRERHDLQWPAATPLPRIGDTLTRRTYEHIGEGPGARVVIWEHLVLRYTWETIPGQGSEFHPMLSALVLELSEGWTG